MPMRCTETPLEDWVFAPDYAMPLVENQFGVLSLEGFGLAGRTQRLAAAGAILHYVRSTRKGHAAITGPHWILRPAAVPGAGRGDSAQSGIGGTAVRRTRMPKSLFSVALMPPTPMGKRLLRAWILRPSVD